MSREYPIRTILDLIRIPPDRLDACLVELREFIIEARQAILEEGAPGIPVDMECPEMWWVDSGTGKA